MLLDYIPPQVLAAVVTGFVSLVVIRWVRAPVDTREPPTLPSWVPWIGHGIAFMWNSNGVIERAIKHFASRGPFTLRIAGERLYVITDPSDVRQLFKTTKGLSFDPFIEEIALGVYKFQPDDHEKLVRVRSAGISVISEAHNFYRRHLLPGPHLDDLRARYIRELQATIDGISFPPRGEGVDLYQWVCEMVVTASSNAVLGRTFLARRRSQILDALFDFDDAHIYMLYGLPQVFTAAGCRGRDLLVDELEAYLFSGNVPEEDKTAIIWTRQKRLVEVGFTQRAAASLQLTVYWAMQTNSMRVTFWMLAEILRNPELHSHVLLELAPAFTSQALTDASHITESCATLTTIYQETLRLTSGSATSRIVTHDTPLNEYVLLAGSKVLAPSMQAHLDAAQWGSDARSFRPSRWTAAAADTEQRMGLSFRPFGGGETYCPGRHFARTQVLTAVAATLWRWRVTRLEGIPVVDRTRPAIGILDPRGALTVWWEERMG